MCFDLFHLKSITWHINVDGDDAITASYDRVRVVVVAATVGTASHRHDPLRCWHLIVDFSESRCHLVSQRTRDKNAISLTRTGSEHDAVAIHVVAWRGNVHHFNGAAGQSECQRPQRSLENKQFVVRKRSCIKQYMISEGHTLRAKFIRSSIRAKA